MVWNKGKTYEKLLGFEKAKEIKQKISENNGMKGKISWNKGLTEETDIRIKKISETIRQMHKKGLINCSTQRQEEYFCKKCNFQTNSLIDFKRHHGTHNKNRKYNTSLEKYKNYGRTGKGFERVELTCAKCHKKIYRIITEVLKHPQKKYFCSSECQFFDSCKGCFIDTKRYLHYYKSSYELKAIKKLNTDKNVYHFMTNKHTIFYNNKKYIVDFLVLYKNGCVALIEVKSNYTLFQHFENNFEKFKKAIELCKEDGHSFKIWFFDNNKFKEVVLHRGDEYYV